MKMFFVVIVVLVALLATGCTEAPVEAKVPCDLSGLKIKEVKIEGDKDGMIALSLQSALYKKGAKVDPQGAVLSGVAKGFNGSVIHSLTTQLEGQPFASSDTPGGSLFAFNNLVLVVERSALDYCLCARTSANLAIKK